VSEGAGRIIVGVSTSLPGLHALRIAVALARVRGGGGLLAVRSWQLPVLAAGEPVAVALAYQLEYDADEIITQAFASAMGGAPTDVEISRLAVHGSASHAVLSQTTSAHDMIVLGQPVGGSRRTYQSKTIRTCLRYAPCPIMIVPPPEFAGRARLGLLGRGLRREAERITRQLRNGLPDQPMSRR
jgi:nucleotide-binding universal stress UspA family protein